MDGIHDLGGKQGFGRIEVTGDEEPAFHEPWEGRMWGISRGMTRHPGWNAPKFRHTREWEEPVGYLTRPYLDQWFKAFACMLIGFDRATVEEIASGRSFNGKLEGVPPPQTAADVGRLKFRTGKVRVSQPGDPDPSYRLGDRVKARLVSSSGHTRLPAYVRGHVGEIVGYHGVQVLDDAAAHDLAVVEPLYTVRFRLSDLFSERAGCPDRVHLDLWESHLAAAD